MNDSPHLADYWTHLESRQDLGARDKPVCDKTVISFGLLFTGSASKLRPIAPIVALVTAYTLDLLARVEIGELATRGLLYAWLFFGIPAGLTILVNLLVGPTPRRLVERALANRLRRCSAVLRNPNAETRSAMEAVLQQGPGQIAGRLRLAGLEKTSPPQDLAALAQAAASTTEILLLVELVSRDPEIHWPSDVRVSMADVLDQMATILETGGYPVEIDVAEGPKGERLAALSASALSELRRALAGFAEPPSSVAPKEAAAKPPGGFWLPDAFTNPDHVRYALKTTAAAMFCYVVYTLLDWPGIHTSLITCYIVSLGTAAETIEKLTLRILGCLLGAAAGIAAIIYVTPHLTSIWGLLAIVFPVALFSAWIAGGSPRISYAGFQIAFAFFLSVIQGSAPDFDLTIARDRVIGILFGNLVVYLVFTTIWPVSVGRRIDPAITALLRKLGALAAAADPAPRGSLVAAVQAQRASIREDLELARYEPSGLRPEAEWLDARRRALDNMGALEGPLVLSAAQTPALSKAAAERLDALADRLGDMAAAASERSAARPALPRGGAAPDVELGALLEKHIAELDRALAPLRWDHAPA